jgi:uncharacterized protein (DUF433 family)
MINVVGIHFLEGLPWSPAVENKYIEMRHDVYWINGTRVSLDSVVLAFQKGLSPETIAAECFPTLSLEQVYGAIAYYLANRPEIDAYLTRSDAEFTALWDATHAGDAEFSARLIAAQRRKQLVDS